MTILKDYLKKTVQWRIDRALKRSENHKTSVKRKKRVRHDPLTLQLLIQTHFRDESRALSLTASREGGGRTMLATNSANIFLLYLASMTTDFRVGPLVSTQNRGGVPDVPFQKFPVKNDQECLQKRPYHSTEERFSCHTDQQLVTRQP